MGSAVLNKSPSSFIAFVYGFLLISFLLNIPHAQGAVRVYSGRSRSLGVNDGASRVGAPPARPDSNAERSPPKQKNPNSVTGRAVVNCRGGKIDINCLRGSKNESGEPMYNRVEGVPPSYNRGGELYPGRH
ncbi:hypothetical protein LWI29_005898 [Acer saccharum]|uniref:Uncharacterized protein n=1 Tax=Acer saccharum TaxID=4024 RepID=A0AA39SJX8_ACESA|nr:hypothetical protein LWI29_005898 [Acer saccharum]